MYKFFYIAASILALCVALTANGQSKKQAKIKELDYSSFPFGKTEPEVISWLELQPSVMVSKDESNSANHFISYQSVAPFFLNGIRRNDLKVPYFHNQIVKKYVVKRCATIFPNTFVAELYFVRNMSYLAEHRLFLVWCMSRVEAGRMKEIYTDELVKRVALYGVPNNIWESSTFLGTTTYHSIEVDSTTESAGLLTSAVQPKSANVTLWQHDDGATFFMMNDNGMLNHKEYLFVWSTGWGDYLKALVEVQTPLAERFISSKKTQQPSDKK